MKQTELMLGDLVTFKDCLKGGRIIPIEIREIRTYNTDVLVCIDGDQSCDLIELNDEIVGIPITPEILEKNGFYKKRVTWILRYDDKGIDFMFINGMWSMDVRNDLAIKDEKGRIDYYDYSISYRKVIYLHELQHALRLCRIEKEIVL